MNTQSSELQTSRGRLFFWIGLTILPVFWVWWMNPAYFSQRQRRAGWVWTVCYLAALFAFREPLGHHLNGLRFSYLVIALRLGFALWLWLLFRLFSVGQIIIGFIVLTDVIAMVASLVIPAMNQQEASPAVFLFALLPAVWHLLLEPYRLWRREIDPDTVKTLRKWFRILLCSFLILWACAVWVEFQEHYRNRTSADARPEQVDFLRLPPSASHIGYWRDGLNYFAEFDIAERDFRGVFSRFDFQEIVAPLEVRPKSFGNRDSSPLSSHGARITISSGLRYQERWNNGGGYDIIYDRARSRTYYNHSRR